MSFSVPRSKTAAVFLRLAETSLAFPLQYWSFAPESIDGRGAPRVPDKSVRFRDEGFVNRLVGRARLPRERGRLFSGPPSSCRVDQAAASRGRPAPWPPPLGF